MADIPSLLNHYKVYDEGENLAGVSGEFELPELSAITDTLEGTGVLGEIEDPATGQFGSATFKVPFAVLYKDIYTIADQNHPKLITLRGSEQVMDSATGETKHVPVKIVCRGKAKTITNGSAQKGKKMESEIEQELLYYKVEVDGEELVELDKLNFVYKVRGVDLMAQIRANC